MKRKLSLLARTTLLFNGGYGLLALVIVLIGVWNGLSYLSTFDFSEWQYLSENTAKGKGEVIGFFETDESVNDEYIYGYNYVFFHESQDYYWTSYRRGFKYDVGDKVDIEYNPERPYINRIRGMTNSPGTAAVALIALGAGLVVLLVCGVIGFGKLKTIQYGEVSQGKLIKKEATNMEVNDETVYAYTYEYETFAKEKKRMQVRTHVTEKYGPKTQIIYDSRNPSKALAINDLPWPAVDEVRKISKQM